MGKEVEIQSKLMLCLVSVLIVSPEFVLPTKAYAMPVETFTPPPAMTTDTKNLSLDDPEHCMRSALQRRLPALHDSKEAMSFFGHIIKLRSRTSFNHEVVKDASRTITIEGALPVNLAGNHSTGTLATFEVEMVLKSGRANLSSPLTVYTPLSQDNGTKLQLDTSYVIIFESASSYPRITFAQPLRRETLSKISRSCED